MLGDAVVYGAVMVCILGLLFSGHADGEQEWPIRSRVGSIARRCLLDLGSAAQRFIAGA
jgi:hypothetical protein